MGEIGKTPSHNSEAERILIGQLLIDPLYYLSVHSILEAEDFYSRQWAAAYLEYQRIFRTHGQVECGDLLKALEPHGIKLSELATSCDDAMIYRSTGWALKEVLSAASKRRLSEFLVRSQDKLENGADVSELYGSMIDFASSRSRSRGMISTGTEMSKSILEHQGQRTTNSGHIEGVSFGFPTLEGHFQGFVSRRLTILSGPSGHGKTAMVLNWLAEIGIRKQIPCLFASLEMGIEDVLDRLVSILSGIEIDVLRTGVMDRNVMDALELIHQGELHISDNTPRDIHDLSAMIEKYSLMHQIKVFALDYVGEIVRESVKFREDRDERFARWVKILHDTCKRCRTHLIILAQVNSEEQLGESKKMGHLADHILFFKREGTQHILECKKNRFGPSGFKYLIRYNRATQHMKEIGILSNRDMDTTEDRNP